MKKVLSTAAVTLGCVIGAGLVSGREAAVFFGGVNPASLAVFCMLFFCAVYFVLRQSDDAGDITQLGKNLFGRFWAAPNAALAFNYFVCLTVMIAGCGQLCGKAVGLAIAAGSAAAVYLGAEGVKKLSVTLVPLAVICLAAVVLPLSDVKTADVKILAPSCYAAYNAVLASGTLVAVGKGLGKRQAAVSAALASVAFTLLVGFAAAIAGSSGGMPLAEAAAKKGLYSVYTLVLMAGMATATTCAAFPLVDAAAKRANGRFVAVFAVFAAAYAASLAGFEWLTRFALPVASAAALAVFVGAAAARLKKRKARR